jgi:hypothetical protein
MENGSRQECRSPAQFTSAILSDAGDFYLHPDGKRFVVLMPSGCKEAVKVDRVTFIINFFDKMRGTAPVAKR